MHVLLHSAPPALQQATTDPRLCWRLLDTPGKSGSVSCGVIAAFSWDLVHIMFCLCPLYESISQSCVSSGSSKVGVMATSSKRAHAIPKSAAPEPLSLWQSTAGWYLHRRYSNTVLFQSVGSLCPGLHKVCFSPLSVSGGNGV